MNDDIRNKTKKIKKKVSFVVANGKGGVGKSACASQLLAPWLLNKQEEVTVSVFDDVNKRSLVYTDSAINTNSVPIDDLSYLYPAIEKELLNFAVNRIADVGGNKTSEEFVKNLANLPSLNKMVDLFFIPVTSGIAECHGAVSLFEKLISMEFPKNRIVFVLSRTPIYRDYAIDKESGIYSTRMINSFLELFNKIDADIIRKQTLVLPVSDCFISSARKDITIYEMALQSGKAIKDLTDELDELIEQNMLEPENVSIRNKITLLNAIKYGYNISIPFHKKVLEKEFAILDTIMETI
jgi:hypothetical protein